MRNFLLECYMHESIARGEGKLHSVQLSLHDHNQIAVDRIREEQGAVNLVVKAAAMQEEISYHTTP